MAEMETSLGAGVELVYSGKSRIATIDGSLLVNPLEIDRLYTVLCRNGRVLGN